MLDVIEGCIAAQLKERKEMELLRDEFAMKVLRVLAYDLDDYDDEQHFAERVYRVADAMLKAREPNGMEDV